MRTVTETFNVYKFDELDDNVKDKVINDLITFFIETNQRSENIDRAVAKADKMQTPRFASEYIAFEFLANGNIYFGQEAEDE